MPMAVATQGAPTTDPKAAGPIIPDGQLVNAKPISSSSTVPGPILQFVSQGSNTIGHGNQDELVQFRANVANFLETTMINPEFRQALLTNSAFQSVIGAGLGTGTYSDMRNQARQYAMDSPDYQFGGAREGLFESAQQLAQLATQLYGHQGSYDGKNVQVIPSWNNMGNNQVAQNQQRGVTQTANSPYAGFAQHPNEHSPWEDMEVAASTAGVVAGGYNKVKNGYNKSSDAWEKWQNKDTADGAAAEEGETDALMEGGEAAEGMEGVEVMEGAELVGDAAVVGLGTEALAGAGTAIAMATGVGEIALGIAAIGFGLYEGYQYFSGGQAKADFSRAENYVSTELTHPQDAMDTIKSWFGW